MLDLRSRLPSASTGHQRRPLAMRAGAADRELYALVDDFYVLLPGEGIVVEAAAGRTG